MDFAEVLTRAGKIVWKYKILWVFGILANFVQGGSGGSSGGSGNTGFQYSNGDVNLPPEVRRFFFGLENFFNGIEPTQWIGIGLALLFFILLVWFISTILGTIGRVGIIQGTLKAEQGAEKLTFAELFTSLKPYFWRVFGLNLLLGLASFVIIIILLVPFIGLTALTFGLALLCLLPLICVLVPLGWMATVIIEQANIALVVEDLNMLEALQRGWEVFRNNFGSMIVMALILVVGAAIVGLLMALPLIVAFIPFVIGIAGGAIWESGGIFSGGLAVAAIMFVLYLPVLMLLSGILRAYVNTAWTLTYLRLSGKRSEASLKLEAPPGSEM